LRAREQTEGKRAPFLFFGIHQLFYKFTRGEKMGAIQAVVLAGGSGARLGVTAEQTQKCLLPIDGKPALSHIIEALVDAFGSIDLVVGVAHKAEEVKLYIDKNKPDKVTSVTYVPHVLGTEGWGIYRGMRGYIHGPFIGTPGDVLAFPSVYTQAVKLFTECRVDAAMTLSPALDVVGTHGVGTVDGPFVSSLQWPPPNQLAANHLRDMTIFASDTRMFDMIEQYPSPKKSIAYVFMKAIRDNRSIAGNVYDGHWIHIGYPEDLQKSMVINYSLT
jgi:NDP-sugar pyrophosphorylase family protein